MAEPEEVSAKKIENIAEVGVNEPKVTTKLDLPEENDSTPGLNSSENSQLKSQSEVKTAAGLRTIQPMVTANTEEYQSEQATVSVNTQPDLSLPDSTEQLTSKTTDNMQTPNLFDTKEYHLPISQSAHSHNFWLGTIIAGILFTVVIVGGTLLLFSTMNS